MVMDVFAKTNFFVEPSEIVVPNRVAISSKIATLKCIVGSKVDREAEIGCYNNMDCRTQIFLEIKVDSNNQAAHNTPR